MQYKNYTIRTAQDSLDLWTAYVDDPNGDTVAQVPAEGEYGKTNETEAITLAKWIITRYQNSYEPTDN